MKIEKTETFIEHDIIFDGAIVGNVELCPERKEITRLVIFYQNKGYGTEVVKELAKEGYNHLWVRADNEKAIHVYEKCGFVKDKNTMYEMRYVNKAESEEEE